MPSCATEVAWIDSAALTTTQFPKRKEETCPRTGERINAMIAAAVASQRIGSPDGVPWKIVLTVAPCEVIAEGQSRLDRTQFSTRSKA